jgi:hypothetical protein
MDFILQFVKAQCRYHKVKFKLIEDVTEDGGGFDSESRVLTVEPFYRCRRTGRAKENKPWEVRLNALHEMIHMWQWARSDPNWTIRHDESITLADIIYQYAEGYASFPRDVLRESAKCAMALEFEAEMVSGIIARSMGLEYPRARHIRGGKAYVYSYYFLAVTGWKPGLKLRRKWYKLFRADTNYDLNADVLAEMKKIAEANKSLIDGAWLKGKWVVNPFSEKSVDSR